MRFSPKTLHFIHRFSYFGAIALFVHMAISFIAGCSGIPTWLTDAQTLLPVIEGTIGAILSVVAAISGSALTPAESESIQTIITTIGNSITNVEAVVKAYESNPKATTAQDIETAAAFVITQIKSFLSGVQITNPAVQQKVVAILSAVLSEFTAWASLIPTLSATAGQQVTLRVPMTKDQFKAEINSILEQKTGDANLDNATAKRKL
jgi:hypothetical protein